MVNSHITPPTCSRIGSNYQAEIPPRQAKRYNHDEDKTMLDNERYCKDVCSSSDSDSDSGSSRYCNNTHCYDQLWDQVRAKKAEEQGEDINGFLNGHELVETELLMELLHRSSYSVEFARKEYARIIKFHKGTLSCSFNAEETQIFDHLIRIHGKDFRAISSKLRRTPGDCMIHYYNWKKSSNRKNPANGSANSNTSNKSLYHQNVKQWKPKPCKVCHKRKNAVMICDVCEFAYHGPCLNSQLRNVKPKGFWICPNCAKQTPTYPNEPNEPMPVSDKEPSSSTTSNHSTISNRSSSKKRKASNASIKGTSVKKRSKVSTTAATTNTNTITSTTNTNTTESYGPKGAPRNTNRSVQENGNSHDDTDEPSLDDKTDDDVNDESVVTTISSITDDEYTSKKNADGGSSNNESPKWIPSNGSSRVFKGDQEGSVISSSASDSSQVSSQNVALNAVATSNFTIAPDVIRSSGANPAKNASTPLDHNSATSRMSSWMKGVANVISRPFLPWKQLSNVVFDRKGQDNQLQTETKKGDS